MKEIIHTLENMKDEQTIEAFIRNQSTNQLYLLENVLLHTNEQTQLKWDKLLASAFRLSE